MKKPDLRLIVQGRTVFYADNYDAISAKIKELGLKEGEYTVEEHGGWGAG